jgi:hypothetical protein
MEIVNSNAGQISDYEVIKHLTVGVASRYDSYEDHEGKLAEVPFQDSKAKHTLICRLGKTSHPALCLLVLRFG